MSLGGDGAVHCDLFHPLGGYREMWSFSFLIASAVSGVKTFLPCLWNLEVQRYTGFIFKMADFRKSDAFRSYGVKECLILVVISSGLYVASIRFLPLSPNTNWRSSIH